MARKRMTKRNVGASQGAKENRDYIAIVAKNKLVGIWTGDEETSKFEPAPNDRDTRLGALHLFDEVLDKIPTNDELLDKQVAIYGLDCLIDCMQRPGDVIRSQGVSEEAKELIPELALKFFDRSYNCFLVSEKGSNATIVKDGFDWLQETSERLVAGALGVEYSKPSEKKSSTTEIVLTPMQKLEAKLADVNDALIDAEEDDVIAKLESKKARIVSMIAEEQARVVGIAAQA